MDLAHPLASFASPAEARVLEVLAGTSGPLSGREIGRIGEWGSSSSPWRALTRLVDQGIVLVDHRGNTIYYTANRDHLAWPAIEQIARVRTELFSRLAHLVESWAFAPSHVSVFGSVARADADAGSDVDILLVRPDLPAADLDEWDAQVAQLRTAVHRWTGNECQAFVVDPARLAEHARANDPLVRAWLADGIRIAGAPLSTLLHRPPIGIA